MSANHSETVPRSPAQTKITRTREKVLSALEELFRAGTPAGEIKRTAICKRAGVSTDVLYSAHHRDLLAEVDRRLGEQLTKQADKQVTRRKRLPVSMTASTKILQLEEELNKVKAERDAALHAANVLSQIVASLTNRHSESRLVLPFPSIPDKPVTP